MTSQSYATTVNDAARFLRRLGEAQATGARTTSYAEFRTAAAQIVPLKRALHRTLLVAAKSLPDDAWRWELLDSYPVGSYWRPEGFVSPTPPSERSLRIGRYISALSDAFGVDYEASTGNALPRDELSLVLTPQGGGDRPSARDVPIIKVLREWMGKLLPNYVHSVHRDHDLIPHEPTIITFRSTSVPSAAQYNELLVDWLSQVKLTQERSDVFKASHSSAGPGIELREARDETASCAARLRACLRVSGLSRGAKRDPALLGLVDADLDKVFDIAMAVDARLLAERSSKRTSRLLLRDAPDWSLVEAAEFAVVAQTALTSAVSALDATRVAKPSLSA